MSHVYDALRPYQKKAASWGARTGSFLLADEPGLGKTIETLGTLVADRAYNRPEGSTEWHLIVSPKVAIDNVWTPEVRRWLPDVPTAVLSLTGTILQRQEAIASFSDDDHSDIEHVFVVANIEALRIRPTKNEKTGKKDVFLIEDAILPGLFEINWTTVVVDECHRALIRTKGIPSQSRAGLSKLKSHRRIALSGTPMRGKPEQLWGTLNWLRPDVYTSYWKWVQTYFQLSSNGYSNYLLDGFQSDGEARLARDMRTIVLRRTKAEVLPELPPKTYAGSWLVPAMGEGRNPLLGVWLEPSPKQKKQIAEFAKEGVVLDEDSPEVELIANGVLAQYTRARQLAGAVHTINGNTLVPTLDSPKYEWLKDFIEELDGQRVVVASQYTSIIDAFAAGLRAEGVATHVLTGKTSDKARTAMIQNFQSDEPTATVFFINTAAGGVAVTLDMADHLVLLDETTIPDDQEQVEDRVHRASRMHNVTIYYLRTLGTIEEEVAYIAAARQDVQKYLLDGARGVEHAKQVYIQSKGQK